MQEPKAEPENDATVGTNLGVREVAMGAGRSSKRRAEGRGADKPQCDDCRHGRANRGLILDRREIPHFCGLTQEVRDPAAAVLIEGLLTASAWDGRCPKFQAHAYGPDAYRSQDLPQDQR